MQTTEPPATSDETPGWVEVYRSAEHRTCLEHSLVLQALQIEQGILQRPGAFVLLVQVDEAQRARHELERYAEENRHWPPVDDPPGQLSEGAIGALFFCGLLLLLGLFQSNEAFGYDWLAAGRNHAGSVISGELWRAFTALTLHADINHLLSNVVFGFLFTFLTCEILGAGLGLTSILAAGGLGNLLNSLLQSNSHNSIGASTAVFAALGILVGYQWRRRKQLRHRVSRRWVPVIAGISLVGFLGVEGERTDVVAHLTGFVAGSGVGVWLGASTVRARLDPIKQTALLLLGPAAIALAWIVALL